MPSLSTEYAVVPADEPPVKRDVDSIFKRASELKGTIRISAPSEVVSSFKLPAQDALGAFDFAGKDIQGTVQCSYAVAGAWNVAAYCTLEGNDGKEYMWAGWVFDYDPHGSDEGADPPARFSFCFSPELVNSDDFSDALGKVKNVTVDGKRYVCIDGFVDNADYYSARFKGAYVEGMKKGADLLSEVGLYQHK